MTLDMVGLRWPVAGASRAMGIATPVITEMKTGDGALASHALGGEPEQRMPGLVKHVRDIERFLTPAAGEELSGPYRLLRGELLTVLATKRRLGLPSLPARLGRREITELTARPEVIFVIANHQPRSTVLQRELELAAAPANTPTTSSPPCGTPATRSTRRTSSRSESTSQDSTEAPVQHLIHRGRSEIGGICIEVAS